MREIDLAGLLDPIESVLITDSLVREEFKHVDEVIWKQNRPAFLRMLSKQEPFINPNKNVRLAANVEELILRRYA
jgi:predicted metal-dependent HD superfamily phosphohydrolase